MDANSNLPFSTNFLLVTVADPELEQKRGLVFFVCVHVVAFLPPAFYFIFQNKGEPWAFPLDLPLRY